MSRFSTLPTKAPAGPSNIQGAPARTFEGGAGFAPGDPHVELFNAAVSGFLADQFYESGDGRIERIVDLVKQCDPSWLLGFAGWLRDTANMRSASVVIGAEYARLGHPNARSVVNSVLQRPDEPGEMLAYWLSHYGRPIPSRVKRGVADAVTRLYTERALLRYDGSGRGWRFGDVIEMVHPTPKAPWQSDLFRFALDRRRHGDEVPGSLGTIRSVTSAMSLDPDLRRDVTRSGLPEGFSWERLAGWLPGGMDAEAWEAVIPQMGLMAIARNLNNFDRAGISADHVDLVRSRLTDPEQIRNSRMMPFRFLTAYCNLEADTYKLPLGAAADIAVGNMPHVSGRALIMVDCSGSMAGPVGAGKSRLPLRLSQLAGFMAEVLGRSCDEARIVCYDTSPLSEHTPKRHVGVLTASASDAYRPRGGTYTWGSTEASYRGEDLVVVITDEQAHDRDTGAITAPVVTWNLAGYRYHHADHGSRRPNRLLVSGVGDSAIQMLPSVVRQAGGRWPWE